MKGIVLYPISANPPTWGHADILFRAAGQFEKIYWSAAVNSSKKYLFSSAERMRMMQAYVTHYRLENVEVTCFEGATVRYAERVGANFLLKGLRNSNDYLNESQQALANHGINANISTLCMFAQAQYAPISSSLVRELAFLGENIDPYVLPLVAQIVHEAVKRDI